MSLTALTVLIPVMLAADPVDVTQPLTDLALLDYRFQSADEVEATPAPAPYRFGQEGSRRWDIHGGYGVDVKTSDNQLAVLGVGYSYFFAKDISLTLELNAMYLDQNGGDAGAGNFNVLFRWHMISEDTWSLYFEGGAGLFLASEHVPINGSSFNFTPQAGVGLTFDIGDDRRLMTGVRWHHISNASLYSTNPGRDSIMGYVGVSFGF